MSHPDVVKHFTISGGESRVQATISKLKFISKLRSGEKFNPQTLQIRDDSYYSCAVRTLNPNENKDLCFLFIQQTISEGIDLYYFYSRSPESFHTEISKVLKAALVESKEGIDSQKETYSKHRSFCTQLDALKATMDAKMQNNRNLIGDGYSSDSEPVDIRRADPREQTPTPQSSYGSSQSYSPPSRENYPPYFSGSPSNKGPFLASGNVPNPPPPP
jgi:hypothetical protein